MNVPKEGTLFRRPKKTPVWAWRLYACLAFLIIGFIFYQLFSILEKEQERNHAFEGYYKMLKCSTLCPVESILNEEQRQVQLFDASCQGVCEKKYLDSLSDHERSLLDVGQFQEDPNYANFINYTRRYTRCYSQMNSNARFDRYSCFQDLFLSMRGDVDLFEVRVPSYTSYAFSIVDFSCNPPSVKVSHIRGASNNLSLVFILEDIRGQRKGITFTSVPFVRDSKTYPLTISGMSNLSKVAFFAQDTSTHQRLTNELWKQCPS